MKILKDYSEYPKNVSLILGFFDGIHLAHQKVISTAIDFAKSNNTKTLLITFSNSPAKYFQKGKSINYIYPRKKSFELISELGVDYLLVNDFEDFVSMEAKDYLENYLIKNFSPISISTGFNHTFGKNKLGNSEYLQTMQEKFGYKYLTTNETKLDNETISSTIIKQKLACGDITTANKLLSRNFSLKSNVINGAKLGRKIGFPTANMKYPQDIIKLPYGVYKVLANNKLAILNWGIKPTINGNEELLEAHILNFQKDLYGKELEIEFIERIRSEKKFDSLEDLRKQIKKDIEVCLK